ncbi:Sec-independent protein translocase protein TatAy [archaeon]|nr:Sec-independent protein translocase protein TatAy [archaeon]
MIGTNELLIILVVVLVLFGGNKLPELARSVGKARVEFKKGIDEEEEKKEEENDRK